MYPLRLTKAYPKRNWQGISIIKLEVSGLLTGHPTLIGIDPGIVYLGLAQLFTDGTAYLHQIEMPSTDDPVERIVGLLNLAEYLLPVSQRGVIEQASYGDLYGQVPLAEVRAAWVVGLLKVGTAHIDLVVPGRVRKGVFENGKTKAEQVWPELSTKGRDGRHHNDVASALACALYAWKLEEGSAHVHPDGA